MRRRPKLMNEENRKQKSEEIRNITGREGNKYSRKCSAATVVSGSSPGDCTEHSEFSSTRSAIGSQ